jgi:RNA-directed DNA polymerase
MLPVKERMQKISNNFDNYLGKDRMESVSYQGVQTYIGITETTSWKYI